MTRLNLFIFIILIPLVIRAENDKFHINRLNYCSVSRAAINDYEPEHFQTTNNLLRKTGESPVYCGRKILVTGRVLDQNCVPVSDAKVYIWQANCDGKYPYKPLKTIVDKKLIDIDNASTFTGNGTATTNNKGEFYFITTCPPSIHNISSHINARVEHYRLGSLQTRLVLKGKKVDNLKHNPELSALFEVANIAGINIYDFKIVLPGDSLRNY